MRGRGLSEEERKLLFEVVERRSPELKALVVGLGAVPLTDSQREVLRESLVEEMCDTGLRADGEPNERGRAVDRVIGLLGQY